MEGLLSTGPTQSSFQQCKNRQHVQCYKDIPHLIPFLYSMLVSLLNLNWVDFADLVELHRGVFSIKDKGAKASMYCVLYNVHCLQFELPM